MPMSNNQRNFRKILPKPLEVKEMLCLRAIDIPSNIQINASDNVKVNVVRSSTRNHSDHSYANKQSTHSIMPPPNVTKTFQVFEMELSWDLTEAIDIFDCKENEPQTPDIDQMVLLNNPLHNFSDGSEITETVLYSMEKFGDLVMPTLHIEELVATENVDDRVLEEETQENTMEICGTQDSLPTKHTLEACDKNKPGIGSVAKPDEETVVFKKPITILGPIRGKSANRLSRKVDANSTSSSNGPNESEETLNSCSSKSGATGLDATLPPSYDAQFTHDPQFILNDQSPIPYIEPSWSGYPSRVYGFEIIKGGQVIENFDLSKRSCHSIGRSPTSDIILLHPTMSRFHAIIQYRDDDKGTKNDPPGMYLYDMGSTHGTYLNKNRIKSKIYVPIRVGHVLKFGASTRNFVLKGPQDDEEEESNLTVTQIQTQRSNELIRRKLEVIKGKVPEEEQGISWGMDDDADEENDLSVNPFASTNNEELYVDDPKKTLRGWFEREGHDLVYNVEEKSSGQFRCYIDIPVESCRGGVHMVEAIVKGKKKEAVVQCALEACRVLDQYGLLRQATHESKKRKAKDWEAEDYYDSDDDTFLDRTGTVEKKRKARIEAHSEKKPFTYEDLVKKLEEITSEIQLEEAKLLSTPATVTAAPSDTPVKDVLDEYLSSLTESQGVDDKIRRSQTKKKIQELKEEAEQTRRLINRIRPLDVPKLESDGPSSAKPKSQANVFERMSAISRKAKVLSKRKMQPGGLPSGSKTNARVPNLKTSVAPFAVREDAQSKILSKQRMELSVPSSSSKADIGIGLESVFSGFEESSKELKGVAEGSAPKYADEYVEKNAKELAKKSVEEQSKISADEVIVPQFPGVNEYLETAKQVLASWGTNPDNSWYSGSDKDPQSETGAEYSSGYGTAGAENQEGDGEEKKKRKRRRVMNTKKNSKCKVITEKLDEVYDWEPPENQSGDGRTSLNDKFGY